MKNDAGFLPSGKISFDIEYVDTGNDFDFGQGTFIAPVDGIYWFIFTGYAYGSTYASVNVKVNDDHVMLFRDDYNGDSQELLNFQFSLDMKKNDKISLESETSTSLYADYERVMTFAGLLIN